ncbi:MAG: NADH-quinone oxidoreductase subunit I [Candidatus Sumerlaeota bacterium]|nr:NADH-quinone oxidoreductase subunit I [Candidatus Sumerlaeota bacterium]
MAPKQNPVAQYFANIYQAVATTLLGMKLTIGYFFRKPVTMLYPEMRPVVQPGARGLHEFDEAKCIACKMCMTACPVDCLVIEFEGRGKDAFITRYDIDYQKCLFCQLCCDACPTEGIRMTGKWDLASYDRAGCLVRFARPKSTEEIRKFREDFARAEAEKKRKAAEAKAKAAAEAKPAAAPEPEKKSEG